MWDVDLAVRLSLATSLSYQLPAALSTHNLPYATQLQGRLRFSEQITDEKYCASCTLFDATTGEGVDDGIVVAFRGSTAWQNYASMFDLRLVPSRLEGNIDASAAGKVHKGYQEASLRLYSRLQPILEQRKPCRTVFVGHSFGGGTSTMCALIHAADEVVTFAGPRVGDRQFSERFNDVLGQKTTHFVHDLDPVLAQNQPLWNGLGFAHTGSIVKCSPTTPKLLIGNEKLPGLPLNFADHALYLGTRMGPI